MFSKLTKRETTNDIENAHKGILLGMKNFCNIPLQPRSEMKWPMIIFRVQDCMSQTSVLDSCVIKDFEN